MADAHFALARPEGQGVRERHFKGQKSFVSKGCCVWSIALKKRGAQKVSIGRGYLSMGGKG
eukprot:1138657-Pelagomonas_calceolata.AAC.3